MNPDKMRGFKEGVREIQSPLGDGNGSALTYKIRRVGLEKYSSRWGTETPSRFLEFGF